MILLRQNGGRLDAKVWGDGRGPSLQQFLDENLSEMSYDEHVHIVTKVASVVLETRCPYPHHDHMTTQEVRGDDGDVERLCIHGVGHDGVHTCDGCCTREWPL